MGKRRNKGRAVDGVLVLDKPAGCTSNEILQRVKRMFGAAKAGHTGSLDPVTCTCCMTHRMICGAKPMKDRQS